MFRAADVHGAARHNRGMLKVPGPTGRAARALDRTGLLALLGCIALLLGISGASIWQAGANTRALETTRVTRQSRASLGAILNAMEDAETAQRGFLLTQDADYLQPFQQTERVLPGLLAALDREHPGDGRAVLLHQVLAAKMAELSQTIRLAQAGQLEAALRIVRTDTGNVDMMLIRKYVAALEGSLDAVLERQVAAIVRGGGLLVAIDVAGLVMILALAGLIALGLQRYLRDLRLAQAQAAAAYDALELSNERLDETVRLRTAELTDANEEIQRFAYIVSHDLRAPLVNIMGFTSELEHAAGALSRHVAAEGAPAELREMTDSEIPEALRFIRSSTSKMDRLINAILRLSREGRRVLAPEWLDMQAILRTMVDSLQHQIVSSGASVVIGALPPLVADRLAVEQVFSNVVENALKYLKPGRPGEVRVSGRSETGMVRFEIADNGRGIAERDYERVFELFRRAGDQSVPGEGIGLAHVRALVRRLGGRIDCRSTLDSGTTFTILLPSKGQPTKEMTA